MCGEVFDRLFRYDSQTFASLPLPNTTLPSNGLGNQFAASELETHFGFVAMPVEKWWASICSGNITQYLGELRINKAHQS